MKPVYVHGIGLWSPGVPDAVSWFRGQSDPELERPGAELLQGAIRRRATGLTRLAVDVLQQAAKISGFDLQTVPTVWASAHGEHTVAVELLEMLNRGEGRLSPTKFHNSVYNTASGYASIATGNRAPSTTLSGGPELVATTLLEAGCRLQRGASGVIAVLADEPMRSPFDARGCESPLAVALALSPEPDGASARIDELQRNFAAGVPPHPRFGRLYIAAILPLVEHVLAGRSGRVALELDRPDGGPFFAADVAPV